MRAEEEVRVLTEIHAGVKNVVTLWNKGRQQKSEASQESEIVNMG